MKATETATAEYERTLQAANARAAYRVVYGQMPAAAREEWRATMAAAAARLGAALYGA